jgi:hypothetical protein
VALKVPGVQAYILFGDNLTVTTVTGDFRDAIDHQERRSGQAGIEMFRRVRNQSSIRKSQNLLEIKMVSSHKFFVSHHHYLFISFFFMTAASIELKVTRVLLLTGSKQCIMDKLVSF